MYAGSSRLAEKLSLLLFLDFLGFNTVILIRFFKRFNKLIGGNFQFFTSSYKSPVSCMLKSIYFKNYLAKTDRN